MDASLSLILSLLALIVSGMTAWLTLLRRATVRMTQPTTIYFGPDSRRHSSSPKVYLRTLLYATAKRGCTIESMFVKVWRNNTSQVFNVWVYGDEHLQRGSGLFIPESGITTNHHFLLPFGETTFSFLAGRYEVEVFTSVVGESDSRLLGTLILNVNASEAEELNLVDHGLYFDWGPDETDYTSTVRVTQEDAFSGLRELFR